MSFASAVQHLTDAGFGDRVVTFDVSSATVELAASAVGCPPAQIAKTLTFDVGGTPVLIVFAGDARVDNRAFKDRFSTKARMMDRALIEEQVGHAPGGVCPFGVRAGVDVYLDESLRRFDVIYPAAGSSNSAVRLSPEELERVAAPRGWVSVGRL